MCSPFCIRLYVAAVPGLHGGSTPPIIPGAPAWQGTDGERPELRQQQDIEPEDTQQGHGRDALQAHLIPRSQVGAYSDAHKNSGTPRGMPHDPNECEAESHKLKEEEKEESTHDDTRLLSLSGMAWKPTCPLTHGAAMPDAQRINVL
jgi:hypothetical protein